MIETRYHWVVVILAFSLTIVTTGVILQTLGQLEKSQAALHHIRDTLDSVRRIRALMVDAETGQRGYLLTHDETYLAPLERARLELPKWQQQVASYATEDDQLFKLMTDFQLQTLARFEILNEIVALARNSEFKKAIALVQTGRGKLLMDASRRKLDNVEAHLAGLARGSEQDLMSAMRVSRMATIGLGSLGAVLVLILSIVLFKEFQRRRRHSRQLEHDVRLLTESLRARAAELERVSSRLQVTSEEEKANLARELHDEFGGILTAIKIDLSWLEGRAQPLEADFTRRVGDITTRVDTLIDLKRRVIEDLRPTLIDNLGLEAAIRWYAEENTRKANVALELDIEPLPFQPDIQLSIAIFRIAQEAMTNALKYASATTARVSLRARNDRIHLTIADDGQGMDLALGRHQTGHGIEGMKYRVESRGGQFSLKSTPGEGTVVSAALPYVKSE